MKPKSYRKALLIILVIIILLCLLLLPIIPVGTPYYRWEKEKSSQNNSENTELDGTIFEEINSNTIRIGITNLIRYNKNEPIFPKNITIKSFSIIQNRNIITDMSSVNKVEFRASRYVGNILKELDKAEIELFHEYGFIDLSSLIEAAADRFEIKFPDGKYKTGYLDFSIDDLQFNNRGKITASINYEYTNQLGENFEIESRLCFNRKFHSTRVQIWLFIILLMFKS